MHHVQKVRETARLEPDADTPSSGSSRASAYSSNRPPREKAEEEVWDAVMRNIQDAREAARNEPDDGVEMSEATHSLRSASNQRPLSGAELAELFKNNKPDAYNDLILAHIKAARDVEKQKALDEGLPWD